MSKVKPKEKAKRLYTAWAKFGALTEKEKEVLREAGTRNCWVLNDDGAQLEPGFESFLDAHRYQLKTTYKIPAKPDIIELKPRCLGRNNYMATIDFPLPEDDFEDDDLDNATVITTIGLTSCPSYPQFRGFKWSTGTITWTLNRRENTNCREWPVVLWCPDAKE